MAVKRVLSLVVCLLLAGMSIAATKTVKLKGGGEITGEVVKTEDGYEIKTASGIVVTKKFDEVESVEDVASSESEYEKRLSKIDKDDPEERFKLASWAFDRRMYKVALKEAGETLKLKKDHEGATLLQSLAKDRLKEDADNGDGEDDDPNATSTNKALAAVEKLLIPEEDIYRVRLRELRTGYDDNRLEIRENVRIQMKNDVVERFIDAYQNQGIFRESRNADRRFRRLSNRRKTEYMLQVLPEDSRLLDDIYIMNDPRFMDDFKRLVMPLVRNMAPQAFVKNSKSELKLINVNSRNPRVPYTNFVLLAGFVDNGKRMIDRTDPEMSLLLQWGLPAKVAKIKNPDEGVAPVFRSTSDPKYRRVFKWIESLRAPEPDYNLKWDVPEGYKVVLGSAALPPPKSGGSDDDDDDDDDGGNPNPDGTTAEDDDQENPLPE